MPDPSDADRELMDELLAEMERQDAEIWEDKNPSPDPEPPSQPDLEGADEARRPGGPQSLVRASSLADLEDDEPIPGIGGTYKGFPVLDRDRWPDEPSHQALERRFYIFSATGITGLVPWPGSQIVWPWEAGWKQDLTKETVHSLLKEEKKERKPR